MKTEVVKLGPLLLGGMCFYGDPISVKGSWDSENEIGKTCKRFADFVSEHPVRPYSKNIPLFYEVHVYGSETMSKGYFEVFVGEEVNTDELPIELSCKYIPASDYIKITLYGSEIISDWWENLDTEVIPAFGLKRNFGYIIQAYGDGFKGMDNIEDSVMNAYIPVIPVKQ